MQFVLVSAVETFQGTYIIELQMYSSLNINLMFPIVNSKTLHEIQIFFFAMKFKQLGRRDVLYNENCILVFIELYMEKYSEIVYTSFISKILNFSIHDMNFIKINNLMMAFFYLLLIQRDKWALCKYMFSWYLLNEISCLFAFHS